MQKHESFISLTLLVLAICPLLEYLACDQQDEISLCEDVKMSETHGRDEKCMQTFS
jgi:hypothetical protein